MPVTVKSLFTEEEAKETNPPLKVPKPVTEREEEADSEPRTVNWLLMVVEPVESKPPKNEETPEVAVSEVRETVWKAAEPETERAA